VFLQVARDLHRFSGDDDACRRWVFTIAHHRLIDARRREVRRPQVASYLVPDEAAVAAEADDAIDAELLVALDRLTPEQREVVVLRFVADLSLEAVARVTRRRVGAVKAMQHRALEQLGRILRAPSGADSGDG
jgi:RNA polymerase sigma-70 factor (ECF subfamily)